MQLHEKHTRSFQNILLSPNFKALTPVYVMTVFPTLWHSARSYSLGNMLLIYQKFFKNYYQKHMLLTRHPYEIWRIKGEMRIPSQPIFGIRGECSPLYSAIKQNLQRQPLCQTGHGRAGCFFLMFLMMPGVVPASSSFAICATVFTLVMNSGCTLEERLSETGMRKINFKAPKTAGTEGHRTLTLLCGFGILRGILLRTTNRQALWNRVASLTVRPRSSENTRGEDHPVLSTINSCSFFFWSWKICFFVDLPSDQPFHFSFLPSVLASNFWCCDGSCPGTCHKLNITIYKRIQTSFLTKQEKTHRLRKQT